MAMGPGTAKVIAFGAAAAGLFVVGSGIAAFENAMFPESDGAAYLQKQGFKDVKDGRSLSFFNTCGDGIPSRRFTVTAPDGKPAVKTVCFSLFGPYRPLLGD